MTNLPSEKPCNPKDLIGVDRMPFHLWPETATMVGSLALLEGACKYGRTNWRAVGVRASVYVDACRRHMNAWFEGEEDAPDSGVPHLGHALACIAILIDAKAAGMLQDDRMVAGGYQELLADLTSRITEIKAKHADKRPRHYTIQDSEVPGDD